MESVYGYLFDNFEGSKSRWYWSAISSSSLVIQDHMSYSFECIWITFKVLTQTLSIVWNEILEKSTDFQDNEKLNSLTVYSEKIEWGNGSYCLVPGMEENDGGRDDEVA